MKTYTLTMVVIVHDEDALRVAAEARYMEENGYEGAHVVANIESWRSMRASIADDIQMLLDPGVLTDTGLSIEDCHVGATHD